MTKHQSTTETTRARRLRRARVLGIPVPVLAVGAVVTAGAAAAAVLFGVGFQGKGGRAVTLSAAWVQPTGSIGFGTLTDADVPLPTISGGALVIPGDGVAMLPGDGAAYGARIQNNATVGAYVSGLVPPAGYTVPAGWRVEIDDTVRAGCGLQIAAGSVTTWPVYVRVTNVSADSGEVDLSGWTVALTPKRAPSGGWGQILGGVTCAPVVGS